MFLEQGTILGSYSVVKLLGVGGMGSVYLAEPKEGGRQVALKVLHKRWIGRKSMVRRFFAEAHSAGQLDHPNILKVLGFEAHETQGVYFMVMELLKGEELHELLEEEGPLPAARCVAIGKQIASALSTAHDKGLIHRDLKPENIFLAESSETKDHVKVLDFGVAKLIEGSCIEEGLVARHHTARGTTVGTPTYMSPEQICGRQVDARSDIYSLGIILYEMVTCRVPFESASFGELVYKHSAMKPVRPGHRDSIAHPVPPSLDDLIMRCLEKHLADRPQNMMAVYNALEAVVLGDG